MDDFFRASSFNRPSLANMAAIIVTAFWPGIQSFGRRRRQPGGVQIYRCGLPVVVFILIAPERRFNSHVTIVWSRFSDDDYRSQTPWA